MTTSPIDSRPSPRRTPPGDLRYNLVTFDDDLDANGRLVVVLGRDIHLLRVAELQWISAADGGVCLHYATDEARLDVSLMALTEMLGPSFQRINRRMSVRLTAVDYIRPRGRHGESVLVMRDGARLPVTRKYKGALTARLFGGSSARLRVERD